MTWWTDLFELRSLFILCFLVGVSLLFHFLFTSVKVNRTSRFAMLMQKVKNSRRSDIATTGMGSQIRSTKGVLTYKERVYAERAKLNNLSPKWTLSSFQMLQGTLSFTVCFLFLLKKLPPVSLLSGMSFSFWVFLVFQILIIGILLYWLPMWILIINANQKRSEYLQEIALFAERLSLCVNDKVELREIILRASRPLKLLKPHVLNMAERWQVNQKQAIWELKESVGITEIYPLINALDNISKASSKEIIQVLKDQTNSIEVTLQADIHRKIENAPIMISFLIMVPFFMGLIVFIYPWLVQASRLISTSF